MGPQTEPLVSEGLTRWNPRSSRRGGGQSSGKASLKDSLLRALKFPPTSANLLALAFVFLDIKLPNALLTVWMVVYPSNLDLLWFSDKPSEI